MNERSHSAPDEVSYVLAGFAAHFTSWKGKRIVLHGARDYARALVEAFDEEYHFEAVVADGIDGDEIFGKPALTHAQLFESCPDLVILTERVRHAEAVYQEIGATCREKGVALYDMYGIDWLAMRAEVDAQEAQAMDDWLKTAAPYDIVSFELPDCVMETTPSPSGETSFTCRPEMRHLITSLQARGHRTLFIGRGPYKPEAQLAALATSGLVNPPDTAADVFFMRAGEDGTWRAIKDRYPTARILHVGYGIPKESILPRYYGVDTYRMVSRALLERDADKARLERHLAYALDPLRLKETVEAAIDQAEIVSFDLFDTLLMRSTLLPADVFELVESEALERGVNAQGFAAARRAAQDDPNNSTFKLLYEAVQAKLGISPQDRDALEHLELEVEQRVLVCRPSVCALLRRAVAQGKRVFVVSDMYHTRDTLERLLADNGIEGYEQLIVSCEYGAFKSQGLLEELLPLAQSPDRIAHIGNSLKDDVLPAEQLGMRTVLVPSAFDTALAHGFGRTMRANATLDERLLWGQRVHDAYGDPFAEHGLAALAPAGSSMLSCPSFISAESRPYVEKAALHVAPYETNLPAELRRALLAWYPFAAGGRALFLGADREALVPVLAERFGTVDVALAADEHYDCIVVIDAAESAASLSRHLERLRRALAPDGTLIIGFRNRFGLKYLCGAVDEVVKNPFDSLVEDARAGSFGSEEMARLLTHAGFSRPRTYYVMPDPGFTQAVYTEDFVPATGLRDRVMPFDAHESPLVAAERDLYDAAVEEGLFPRTANYCLMECRAPGAHAPQKQVAHVSLSLDRGPAHSFITTLFDDGTALKAAAHPEGLVALQALAANGEALNARGVSVVPATLDGDGLHMPFVHEQPLLAYLDSLLPDDPAAFVGVFRALRNDALRSSEPGSLSDDDAQRIWSASASELGPVLKTGYIDMVPYNAFWENGTLRYFDQEFSIPNCPVAYVMFRALHYTWIHLPHAENAVPLEQLKRLFGLERTWGRFAAFEDSFVEDNRQRAHYQDIYAWARVNPAAMERRRKALGSLTSNAGGEAPDTTEDQDGKPYEIGLLMGVFDLFHLGHLRLIQRAKKRCRYLRVAVLSDELVQQFKNITPTIPLDQRMEILAAVKGVDEVVAITDNPSRLEEWRRRPFDCFFSGDDYTGNEYWEYERRELEKLGSTIEFFPYTEEQSSTSIRNALGTQNAGRCKGDEEAL